MLVYKMKLSGDQMTYWLTEGVALPIMRRWENGERGVFKVNAYGIMTDLSKIREIRAVEEKEPYPEEFKKQLVNEGTMSLPAPDARLSSISKLPTENILLDKDFKIIPVSINELKKLWKADHKKVPHFYEATCHYKIGENGKEYYIDEMFIPNLLKMRFDEDEPDYPPMVCDNKRYGVRNLAFRESL